MLPGLQRNTRYFWNIRAISSNRECRFWQYCLYRNVWTQTERACSTEFNLLVNTQYAVLRKLQRTRHLLLRERICLAVLLIKLIAMMAMMGMPPKIVIFELQRLRRTFSPIKDTESVLLCMLVLLIIIKKKCRMTWDYNKIINNYFFYYYYYYIKYYETTTTFFLLLLLLK